MSSGAQIYGLMVEFDSPEELLRATAATRRAGYLRMDAYSPYPVDGLSVELGIHGSRLPFVVLIGGILGAATAFFMQTYSMAIDYPLNVGGRPLISWPVFVPITFELLILVAALAAFFGMMFLNGLPCPHHPVFNVDRFCRASQDRFFLCIEATDPKFDRLITAEFLSALTPTGEVMEVPLRSLMGDHA